MQPTGCQSRRVLRVAAHRPSKLVPERCIGRLRVHVDLLSSRVGGGIGGTGVVRAEDLEHAFLLEVLGQPNETRAEHCAGGGQEVELQRFERRGRRVVYGA